MEDMPDNGKQTGAKRQRLNNSPKTTTSPQKLAKGKGKGKGKKDRTETVKVIFQEENDEVVVEVDGIDTEFPADEATELCQGGSNNNAVVSQHPEKVSRADKFRKMVSTATTAFAELLSEEYQEISVNQMQNKELDARKGYTSTEEGETESSDEDTQSFSSSVKILPRTKEDIKREQAEYQQEKDNIINQAVDRSLDKITQFMMESSFVFRQQEKAEDNQANKWPKKGEQRQGDEGKGRKQKSSKQNQLYAGAASSGTTIYDQAVFTFTPDVDKSGQKEVPHRKSSEQNKTNRISSSSDEIIDTSDETIEPLAIESLNKNINDLALITGNADHGN